MIDRASHARVSCESAALYRESNACREFLAKRSEWRHFWVASCDAVASCKLRFASCDVAALRRCDVASCDVVSCDVVSCDVVRYSFRVKRCELRVAGCELRVAQQ